MRLVKLLYLESFFFSFVFWCHQTVTLKQFLLKNFAVSPEIALVAGWTGVLEVQSSVSPEIALVAGWAGVLEV